MVNLRFMASAFVAIIGIHTSHAQAQEFSLADLFAGPVVTTSGWTATVARDPLWTAVVSTPRDARIETGSIAPHRNAAPGLRSANNGPRLTGAQHAMTGIASFYGPGVGPLTASGEVFNRNDMTAAHKTLPMGSKVKVTNLDNGREAVVRINDRGPFVGGRVIDVSEAAAGVLGMRARGLAPVRVDLIGQ